MPRTWRSPVAAMRTRLSVVLMLATQHVRKPPSDYISDVVHFGEQASTAHSRARCGKSDLLLQSSQQFVEQPARDVFSLRRIDESKIEEMHQQHFPILIHVGEQKLPVDLRMLFEDEVRHIGPVVTVAVLNERLRPDQLRRPENIDFHSEQPGRSGSLNPEVGYR